MKIKLNIQRVRNFLSMVAFELPAFFYKLKCSDDNWIQITNRNEKYIPAIEGAGISMLGDFTSELRLANHFPGLSNRLFKKACEQHPFCLRREFDNCPSPEFSFIIGHRGKEKVANLNLVIQSLAGQTNKSFECIVVEQSANPDLQQNLPGWVRYFHQQVDESELYNRSMAFNLGVDNARTENLILHDNDLLIPADYLDRHIKYLNMGYHLVNLKRYIFGLNQDDTNQLHSSNQISHSFSPKYVLQNAKGGGSLVIKKSAYKSIGGFDNRFTGWGGEDNELWQRAQILNIYPFACLPLIHLWHIPQKDKRGGEHGGGLYTEELIDELSRIPIYERIRILTSMQSC